MDYIDNVNVYLDQNSLSIICLNSIVSQYFKSNKKSESSAYIDIFKGSANNICVCVHRFTNKEKDYRLHTKTRTQEVTYLL
jgi:hypothetical protein